jgi:hypothetical protein
VLGGRIDATESVFVEGEHRHHLRSATLDASRPAMGNISSAEMIWHIIQSTEARTLDGTVRLSVLGGATPNGAACAGIRWGSTIGVISHDKKWTVPKAWL